MLDRSRFLQEIQKFSGNLFRDNRKNTHDVENAWQNALHNQKQLLEEIKRRHMHCALPLWHDDLGYSVKVASANIPYTILGVDGSQIYPDRHRGGLQCYMVNIGSVLLAYGNQTSTVNLFSIPHLFAEDDAYSVVDSEEVATKDIVDLRREELEFTQGFAASQAYVNQYGSEQFMCCFDGSFIFWHLESKPQEIKERFLSIYLDALKAFCDYKIVVASYISLPRNRELANLLALATCPVFKKMGKMCSSGEECSCIIFKNIIDSEIVSLYLQPGYRTTVFTSTSYVTREYPQDLVPCFFFMHVGQEIVRVEMPTWVARNQQSVDMVASFLFDQAVKGNGYPVVLAEAHEQAVIKVSEQDFFYEILAQRAAEKGISLKQSQKSLKKKVMGI